MRANNGHERNGKNMSTKHTTLIHDTHAEHGSLSIKAGISKRCHDADHRTENGIFFIYNGDRSTVRLVPLEEFPLVY